MSTLYTFLANGTGCTVSLCILEKRRTELAEHGGLLWDNPAVLPEQQGGSP